MKEDIDNALWNLENLIYHRIDYADDFSVFVIE
jgi:hypothetical protein